MLSELLERQPEEIRTFLLRTSVLENLTAPDCQQLVGEMDTTSCLTYLEKSNWLAISYEGAAQWFRYSEVVREFLELQLANQDPESYREVHGKAGMLHEGRGDYKRAFEHFVKGSDLQHASELTESAGDTLIDAGEREVVRHWLDIEVGPKIRTGG